MILSPLDPATVPLSDIPEALGRLEICRVALLSRLDTAPAPASPGEPNKLLTADQVAEQLGLPTARIYEMSRQGKLPFVRVGKKLVRFERTALDAWIVARRQGKEPGMSLVAGSKRNELTRHSV